VVVVVVAGVVGVGAAVIVVIEVNMYSRLVVVLEVKYTFTEVDRRLKLDKTALGVSPSPNPPLNMTTWKRTFLALSARGSYNNS